MNHLPPVPALKGQELNQAVDDLMRDGVDSTAPKPDLLRQFHELVHINQMMEEGEVRMDMDERTCLWKMMKCLREAIERPQDEVATITDKFREGLEALGLYKKTGKGRSSSVLSGTKQAAVAFAIAAPNRTRTRESKEPTCARR